MWIIDIIIEILTQLFRAGANEAQKRSSALPPPAPPVATTAARPVPPPSASIPPPSLQALVSNTSQDPDYERSGWRTAATVFIVMLLVALVVFWLVNVVK